MKTLVIGDPHITRKRFTKSQAMCAELVRITKEEQPERVVILGDTLDAHMTIHAECLNLLVWMLQEMTKVAKSVMILVGNHEMPSGNEYLPKSHALLPLKNLSGVTVVDQPMVVDGIGYIPYTPAGQFYKAYDSIKAEIVFCHQEFIGCEMAAGIKSEKGDALPVGFYAISGHIHGQHEVGDTVWYVGTPCQTQFGDAEDKSVRLLDIDHCTCQELKKIVLDVPKFITHKVNSVNDIKDIKKPEKDLVRIVVSDTRENVFAYRKSKAYKQAVKTFQLKFDITDTNEIRKNQENQPFQVLLMEYAEREGIGAVCEDILKKLQMSRTV